MKASEFKTHCLQVLDQVERTGEPVTITKRGRVVARLTSARVGAESAPWERLRGAMEEVGDIIRPAVPAGDWDASR